MREGRHKCIEPALHHSRSFALPGFARSRAIRKVPRPGAMLGAQMVTQSMIFSISSRDSRRGDHRADPIAGECVGLGEAVELDECPVPAGSREQLVGGPCAPSLAGSPYRFRRSPGRGSALLANSKKSVDHVGCVNRPRGIVRRAPERSRGSVDRSAGFSAPGSGPPEATSMRQGMNSRLDALHVEPHLMVEIPWHRQEHIVAGPREADGTAQKA